MTDTDESAAISGTAQRAREPVRQVGVYRVVRSTAGGHDAAGQDSRAPRCSVQPCHPKLPVDALVYPGDGRDPYPACELHAAWLLAALPGATVEASPGDRFGPVLDLDLVRRMAQAEAEQHEQMHDGTWACLLCDPGWLPS
ncbi:hypothetical protein ACIOFY_36810 [Streptomyces anulatus]